MHGVVLLAVFKLALRLELGAEYDSNANRAEVVTGASNPDTPMDSFLLRSTAKLQIGWRLGRNQLKVAGLLGGKVFFSPSVQDQNVLAGQLTLDDRLRVHRLVDLGVSADYYDAGQQNVTSCSVVSCDRHRDFRSGSVTARVVVAPAPAQLTLEAGYRGFVWKPDEAFDFHAATAAATVALRFDVGKDHAGEVDLMAHFQLERRYYLGIAEINICPPGATLTDQCFVGTGERRRDWFSQSGLELVWVGPVLLSGGYALQLVQSSSFGQSMLRSIFTLKLGFRLPGQLYFTLKGQVLVNKYLDPVLLDRQVSTQSFISIEDENRNAFVADVERPLPRGVAVTARYSFFANELSAAPVSFMRHVVYLGLTYRYGK